MNVIIAIPISDLSISQRVDIGAFQIIPGRYIIDKFNAEFIADVGNKSMLEIRHSVNLFYEGPLNTISVLENPSPDDLAKSIRGYFTALTGLMWIVKNNSIHASHYYIQNVDEKLTAMYLNDSRNTNNRDESTVVNFDIADFMDFDQYFTKMNVYQQSSDEQMSAIPAYEPNNRLSPLQINYVPYTESRIPRSLKILFVARKASSLIMKITFYISLLECLFTSDDQAIGLKVRKRAAAYVGGSEDDQKENVKKIKKAYNIRSKYIHGDTIATTRPEYLATSEFLDEHIRKIYRKIFIGADPDPVFLYPEDRPGKVLFESFWNELAPIPVPDVCAACNQAIKNN